ncbi:Prolactin-3B1 [Dirofilaria immitis]
MRISRLLSARKEIVENRNIPRCSVIVNFKFYICWCEMKESEKSTKHSGYNPFQWHHLEHRFKALKSVTKWH